MLLGVSFGSSSILFVVGGGGKWVFVFHFVISFLWKLYKSLYQVLKVESKCSHVLKSANAFVHSLAAWAPFVIVLVPFLSSPSPLMLFRQI